MFNKRLFISCPVAGYTLAPNIKYVREELSNHIDDIFRWENQYHITLRFLGNVDINDDRSRDSLKNIRQRLSELAEYYKPLRLVSSMIDTFPQGVLYLDIDQGGDYENLMSIADNLNEYINEQGFPPPDYEFKPHITLVRFDQQYTDKVIDALDWCHPVYIDIQLNRIELLESFRDIDRNTNYRPAFTSTQFDFTGSY